MRQDLSSSDQAPLQQMTGGAHEVSAGWAINCSNRAQDIPDDVMAMCTNDNGANSTRHTTQRAEWRAPTCQLTIITKHALEFGFGFCTSLINSLSSPWCSVHFTTTVHLHFALAHLLLSKVQRMPGHRSSKALSYILIVMAFKPSPNYRWVPNFFRINELWPPFKCMQLFF